MGPRPRAFWGRILVGVKDDILEVKTWNKGRYFVAANIRDKLNNFTWTLIVVYGPANHEISREFITELNDCCHESSLPVSSMTRVIIRGALD